MSRPTSRRGFLLGSAAVATGLAASRLGQAKDLLLLRGSFLYDPRFPDARYFARRADSVSLHCAMLQDPVPQQAPPIFRCSRNVAGLTSYADFTVLTDIARQAGYRLRFHGYHAWHSSNHVSWRLVSDGACGETGEPVLLQREVWERQLAGVFFGHEIGSRHCDAFSLGSAASDRRTLHAWHFERTV